MQISYDMILKKIEEKLRDARGENRETKIREHVQAIKTLCEVILDESSTSPTTFSQDTQPATFVTSVKPISTSSPITSLGEKKLESDDGSNGDSIFDF